MRMMRAWATTVLIPLAYLLILLQSAPAATDEQMIALNEDGLITVSVDDRPLATIVDAFARASGINIITADPAILKNSRVTVNLQDVEWEPALRNILEMYHLDLVEQIPGTEVFVIVRQDWMSQPDAETDGELISVLAVICIIVLMQALPIILNLIFAVAIFIDARRLRQTNCPTRFVPPVLWALTALGAGLLGVALYWMIHYSTLKRKDS
jgi:hypothetical protein